MGYLDIWVVAAGCSLEHEAATSLEVRSDPTIRPLEQSIGSCAVTLRFCSIIALLNYFAVLCIEPNPLSILSMLANLAYVLKYYQHPCEYIAIEIALQHRLEGYTAFSTQLSSQAPPLLLLGIMYNNQDRNSQFSIPQARVVSGS